MHDPYSDRLSDYIDGSLTEAEAADLHVHLGKCAECTALLADLRSVVAAASTLVDREPQRDLWSGIQEGIRTSTMETPPVRTIRRARTFSFSMPQLAAAAVVLMTLTGTAVWFGSQRGASSGLESGTIVQNAGGSASLRNVASGAVTVPEQSDEIISLERALEENRARLDPVTVEVVERSLDAIDRAIEDARSALEADPANPYLHRQLDNTMRKKVDILRRATRVQRGS